MRRGCYELKRKTIYTRCLPPHTNRLVAGGVWVDSVAGDALFWQWGMKMTDYKIENNIPIPPSRDYTNARRISACRVPRKYPFHLMKVGDSFFCLDNNARFAAFTYGKGRGIKFTVRKVQEKTIGKTIVFTKGLRVWRIE